MNPKISIIVPIYNAEKTLHRCIDSILSQDYTDFELLLIDDGSKDASGNFYRVIGERLSHKGSIDEEGVLSKEEFANLMMENPADFYYGVLWNKLYKREIIEKYKFRMDSKISWCEDFMFNLEYIRFCERIFNIYWRVA